MLGLKFLIFVFLYSVIAQFVFRLQENDHEIMDPDPEDFPLSKEYLIAFFWPITMTFYVLFMWPRKLILKFDNKLAARKEKKKLDSILGYRG